MGEKFLEYIEMVTGSGNVVFSPIHINYNGEI